MADAERRDTGPARRDEARRLLAGGSGHVHLVGIGGTGMCGIAEVLLNLRYIVSGSDLVDSETVQRLRRLGGTVHTGHAAGLMRRGLSCGYATWFP